MQGKPRSAIIHPGPGFRVRRDFDRPQRELIERFREFDTPDVSDLMNRLYTMSFQIQNLVNNQKICGPACTVKVFPGDNLMVHKSLDIAKPGDVIVVDAGGSCLTGLLGELITIKAKHRGIAGFVIDGLIRDIEGIKNVGLPVFARGVTPIGPLHRGPGEINYTISCGGIAVNPGDIILGDCCGVIVIRKDVAVEILERMMAQQEAANLYADRVRQGIFSNDWVDTILQDCRFEDEL